MLVTLDEIKTRLGITDASHDDFLNSQNALISETVNSYCGRIFEEQTYTQTFYQDDLIDFGVYSKLPLYHFPVSGVALVEINSEAYTDYRLQKSRGSIISPAITWPSKIGIDGEMEVTYTAGYANIPLPIKDVVLALIEERYNKDDAGINMNFGSNVQKVSIPGTFAIDFDYSLNSNDRNSKFGIILGNNANVLDYYRSERTVIGTIEDYIEVV